MVNINKYLIACSAYKDFYMGKSHEIYEERVLDTSHFIHQQKKNFQRNKLFFFFFDHQDVHYPANYMAMYQINMT